MGQISLPRLEKINTSMSWESSLFFNKEQWANPKLLIINKLLASYVLKKQFSFFKKNWQKNYKIRNFFFLKKKKIKSLRTIKNYVPLLNTKIILGLYIYQFNNSYTTIAVYTSPRHSRHFFNNLNKKIGSI